MRRASGRSLSLLALGATALTLLLHTIFNIFFEEWIKHLLEHRFGVTMAEMIERFGAVAIPALSAVVVVWLLYLRLRSELGDVDAEDGSKPPDVSDGPVYWTLTQALSWIGFGEPYTAAQWKSDYVSRRLGTPDLEKPAIDAAEHALFEKLRDDTLVAQGKKGKKSHVYEPISATYFLSDVGSWILRDEISADGSNLDAILEGGIPPYRDVRLKRADILRLWPVGGTAPASAHLRRTAGPEIFTVAIDQNARQIGDFPVVVAVTLKNVSGQAQDVLVKMESFNGAIPRNMSMPLVLRTENQILEPRSGSFRLRPNESKMIPVLYRDPIRAPDWSFLDEHGKRHPTTATPFKMLLGVYSDTASRTFKLVCDVDAGWKIHSAKVTPVPDGYVLTSDWPD